MNKKFVAANWKMNKGLVQSQQFADDLLEHITRYQSGNRLLIKVRLKDVPVCEG